MCSLGVSQVCPLSAGRLDVETSYTVDSSYVKDIPSIAYSIPNLDGKVRVAVYTENSTTAVACVEAVLTNGKSVQQKGVQWVIAVLSGIGLVTGGLASMFGHSNTAAHISSNSVSLFVYFQSLAITAMMGVQACPNIASSWAQNFQWTLGIMSLPFMQKIFNWYVQATGGTSTSILINKSVLSISVQKRKREINDFVGDAITRVASRLPDQLRDSFHIKSMPEITQIAHQLVPRLTLSESDFIDDSSLYTTDEKSSTLSSYILVLRGIQRVAYKSNIEITNLFLTSITFFFIIVFLSIILIFLVKSITESLAKLNLMNTNKFSNFRQYWATILKGTLYRLFVIGYPQINVLCLWQLCERDSVAIVVSAVCLLLSVNGLLLYAAVRVVLYGRESTKIYKNPAYLLYSDDRILNRLGFLYVQYRAQAYYFVIILLCYILFRSCFIAFAQGHGKIQSVGIFIIEFIYFLITCIIRPYMDKRTNGVNIGICTISLINSILYLLWSNVFGQPDVVGSIAGVVFFVLNAVFALVLLIMIIGSCSIAFFSKNPDSRYQQVKDDRFSFANRNKEKEKDGDTELDALGATAMHGHDSTQYQNTAYTGYNNRDIDDVDGDPFDARFPTSKMPYEGDHNNGLSDSNIGGLVQPTSAILPSSNNYSTINSPIYGNSQYNQLPLKAPSNESTLSLTPTPSVDDRTKLRNVSNESFNGGQSYGNNNNSGYTRY